jgi:hypothetical protein
MPRMVSATLAAIIMRHRLVQYRERAKGADNTARILDS